MSKLKSTYEILSEYNLIVEIHRGVLDVDSYINFKKALSEDSNFKPNTNYLINHKEVTFTTTPTDVQKFVNFIKNNANSLGKRKVALLTDTPNQVVNTTIYKSLISGVNSNNEVEIFSTLDAALNWLINKQDLRSLKEIIFKLEQNI